MHRKIVVGNMRTDYQSEALDVVLGCYHWCHHLDRDTTLAVSTRTDQWFAERLKSSSKFKLLLFRLYGEFSE